MKLSKLLATVTAVAAHERMSATGKDGNSK